MYIHTQAEDAQDQEDKTTGKQSQCLNEISPEILLNASRSWEECTYEVTEAQERTSKRWDEVAEDRITMGPRPPTMVSRSAPPYMAQDGPNIAEQANIALNSQKMGPSSAQQRRRWPKIDPRSPKMDQHRPKITKDRPKSGPWSTQDHWRWPKIDPRSPKMA